MPRTRPRPLKPPASPNAAPNGIGETLEVLTLEEAASYFRVPADAVLRIIDAEGLPARRFGAEWRFSSVALQAWLGAARLKRGILNHIGRIEDDPYAQEMLREIYAMRRRPESEQD
jgi:excisionase family DNA binding protein